MNFEREGNEHAFCIWHEERFLRRIMIAQAATYRRDDKDDRFPSSHREKYRSRKKKITGLLSSNARPLPIASRSTFNLVNHSSDASDARNALSFSSLFHVSHFLFSFFPSLVLREESLSQFFRVSGQFFLEFLSFSFRFRF